MKKLNSLIVLLVSGITLTGISFIDDKIWGIVFLVIGMIAYAAVGLLYSIGVLRGRSAGKDAYALFFTLLLLGGYGVYSFLNWYRSWVLSWPLVAKIIVPIVMGLVLIAVIVVVIKHKDDREELCL